MIYTSGDDDDDDTSIDLFCNNKKFFIRNVIHVNGVTGSTLGENPILQFSTYSYIIWFSRIVTLPWITWCKKFGKNLNPGKIRIFFGNWLLGAGSHNMWVLCFERYRNSVNDWHGGPKYRDHEQLCRELPRLKFYFWKWKKTILTFLKTTLGQCLLK